MPIASYSGEPTLVARFETLKREGRTPREAVEMLWLEFRTQGFITVRKLQHIRPFRVDAAGNLKAVEFEAGGDKIPPNEIKIRAPHPLEVGPFSWAIILGQDAANKEWMREQDLLDELATAAPESSAPELPPKAKSKGGRPTEHHWDSAATYVEEWILKMRRPLNRHPDGAPNIQHAMDLMGTWFKKDPKPPKDPQVRRWINNHKPRTDKWWDDDIVAQLERQNQNRPKP